MHHKWWLSKRNGSNRITAVDFFQKLNGDRFFSKIDLSKRYRQVTIKDEHILKIAFVTPDG